MEPTITIYSIAGEAIATAIVTQEAVIHEELMTSDYVKLSWSSATGETLPAGAYIEHDGERYSLLEPYTPQAESGGEYRYEPEFQSRVMAWGKQVLPLYTYEEDGKTVKTREMDWDFTGSPADAMYMVEQAIRNETGEEWKVELSDSLPATITLSSQSGSILSALNEIASECETEWWADKGSDTLYLSRCQRGEPVALTAGGNVGVPSVTEAKDGYYTRFYVFGSTRNVTQDSGSAATNSVVNKRLTLDPATYPGGYIDAREGLLPGEIFTAILTYDDIYPSSKLEIGDVRARLKYRLDSSGEKIETGADDEGNPVYEQYAIWYFQIPGLDFDPDTIIPQKTLSVHFESGQLAGRDFELAYHEKASQVKDAADVAAFQVKAGDYEIIIDESEGMILPGLAYIIPQDGDKATLYNIKMPAEYTASAQAELAERALKDIARRMADNRSYEMDSNPVAFKEDGTVLSVGQAVSYAYLGVTLETRVLMVERHLDFPWQAAIRVGNELIKGNTQQLKEEVTQASQNIDVLKAFNELSVSLSNSYANAMREMQEGFASIGNMWRVDPDRENTIYSDFNAYVKGWLSAKGANDSQGEGGGGGLSYSRLDTWEGYSDEEKGGWVLSAYLGYRLYRDINDLKSGVAMSYAVQGTGNAITDVTRDSSRWVFTKGKTFSELGHLHKLSDISDLNSSWDSLLKEAPSAYITRWPSWTEVKDKPSTFTPSSHKHVKADITDFPATWAWSAISGKPTTFTPSAHQHPLSDLSDLHSSWDAILKAAPFAGVSRWPSWGEVTGKPTSFTPSSHTHAISQVSGLQAALEAKLPAATFDELFEKVTLESGETAIRAKLGLYSDKWVSAKGANPNQGEGGGFAYTRLDTWEGYDSDTMDGWVLSAKLGYSLYNDVKSLKAGAAVSFTIEGTGNAITDVSKSGTQLVFTRGTTFALSSHQHPLSNISDLNSGWDSLLKTAPSSYVTRWPSWGEVTGKPTTFTPASHTHTISQVSDLHSSWDTLLKAAPSAYVTRWPSIGEVTGKQSLAIKLNGGGTEGTNLFTYNGTAAKTINITASAVGAPTKTGSGASGTWGISISGTAALATRLTPTEYGSGDLDALTHGRYATRFFYAAGGNTTANTPNGGDGFGLFVMRTASGYTGQILMSPYGVLYTRYNGNNAWSAWRTVLDTDNYAATLDGRYLRTVSIATITDLHSSWDALLKAQKPTTLSGYGITNGVTTPAYTGSGNVLTAATVSGHTITFTKGITAALASRKVNAGNGLTGGGTLTADITLNVASANAGITVNADNIQLNTINALTSADTVKPLSAAQGKKIWDFVTDLFEKVNIGTSSAPVYAIRAKYGLFSDEFLSAKGANDSEGEGGGTAYNRLDTWEGYTDALATWVLSAGLGHSLYNDVQSLKAGAAVSLTTQGSGNAVTDIAKSGTKLTVTKGLTFLTAHQALHALTIQGNGTTIGTYTPNAAKTINITPAAIGAATSGHTHSQYLTSVSLATISDLHSSWDAVLKAQKPNWLTSVSLATISDLHANWDALLKAAPSAYVTRWPTAAEVGALTQSTADGRYVNITGDTMTGDLGIGNGRSSIDGSVPYCGSSGIVSKDLTELANYKTVLGAYTDKSGTWYALISVRHRNGLGDGNNYGLYLRSVLTASGNLMWGKQYGSSSWQAERVLLDSANYTSYTVTKTGGGASGTWGIGVSGNAATASKWQTKRTISLTGAVTGSVSLDGSGNVSLATTYAAANISALDSRYVNVSGDTMTGLLSLSSGSNHKGAKVGNVYVNAIDRALIIQNAKEIRFGQSDNWAYNDWGGLTYDHSKKYLYLGIADGTIFQQNAGALSGGSLLTPGIGNIFVGNNTSNKVWHAGNDGSGSGLDADLLDGTHKNGLFTAFSANGNSTRITIGGVTKDLTVPYAKNCDTLDGLHGSSFMACNGLNGISLTGGNGNTEGYRLVIQKTMTAWSINNLVFVVASRHNGQGILSVAFHITADSPSSYGYSIRYFGANLALNAPFRAFYNTSTHVFRLYWHYRDYTSCGINVLRVEGFPSPSNGTWYETLPSDNGTELTIEYNNADTIGGTSKGGLLTALSSSSGTNLSLTVGGTTKTVADLYATAAEKLLTARTINGTSFNGTANIVTSYWGTARNLCIQDATAAHTGAAVSVNGSANAYLKLPATITAALSGNASTASKWLTARTISLGSYLSGSVSLDGSANVTLNANVLGLTSQGRKTAISGTTMPSDGLRMYEVYNNGYPCSYGNLISVKGGGAGELLLEWTGSDTTGHVRYRSKRDNGSNGWTAWGTLAFTTDNVASASKAAQLTTARTLWGQSFNGTANVSGDMTGVGGITATGEIKSSSVNAFRLSAGSYGTILRNSDNNFYILVTNSGQAASGSFNSLRPFYINLSTGNVVMQHRLTVNGVIENGTGIFSNGYVSAKGQNTSSDMRLKRVLGDVSLPLERIAKAPAFEFRWRDGSGESAGSSAQYWRDALPAAVRERGGYLEMQYGNIALISAISIARETLRLATRVSDHERRIRELEAENRRLRAILAA